MSHEPVKLYAAAIIRDVNGKVLLTRHDATSKWHFPDASPNVGESSWNALKLALQEDLRYVGSLEAHPFHVTEIISKDIRHVTLHYAGAPTPGSDLVCRKPMDSVWVMPSMSPECNMATNIMLERLRYTSFNRR